MRTLLLLLFLKSATLNDDHSFDVVSTSTTERPTNYETYNIRLNFQNDLLVKISKINDTLKQLIDEIKEESASMINQTRADLEIACDSKLSSIKEQLIEETKQHISLEVLELKQMFKKQSELYEAKLSTSLSAILGEIKQDRQRNVAILEDIKQNIQAGVDEKSCLELQKLGKKSGVYRIQPGGAPEPFSVFCDMETRGGGWVYVLNRFDGSQDFDLNWEDYKRGFGVSSKELWLGLEPLHQLTAQKHVELLFELMDWDLKKVYVHYKNFQIGSESEGYNIKILGGYSGDTADAFVNHLYMKFVTKDRKQDNNGNNGNCAQRYIGGWWYHGCFHCKLTGNYFNKTSPAGKGIHWNLFQPDTYSLKGAKMMIR